MTSFASNGGFFFSSRRRHTRSFGDWSSDVCSSDLTLFLNPPSFERFDGGASSRWPATREIESYWYPVWLTYPAGMLPGSRLLDAPPHKVTPQQTVEISKDYEFLVLFTSAVGFENDLKLVRRMKEAKPDLKIA